jgi:hypothetical protein
MDCHADLFKKLQDPAFAREYFVQAAQTGDPAVLALALVDITSAADGIYAHVELTKLRACPQAKVPPGRWDKFRFGAGTKDTSLPVDYVLTGLLLAAPQMGQPVIVLRLSRNALSFPGVFESTPVVAVQADRFTTENSIYLIKSLPPL